MKKALCLQTLSQKDGEALHKFLEFDIGMNIFCRFTANRALCCLPLNVGCFFT